MRSTLTLAALLLSLTSIDVAQNPLALRAVSIQRSDPSEKSSLSPIQIGHRVLAKRVTLRDMIFFSYILPIVGTLRLKSQIIDVPDWADTDHFDIEAAVEGDTSDIRNAMQLLLEERFRLKTRREMREMPVFNLVVANSGLKMKLSEDQTPVPRLTSGYDLVHDNRPLPRGALASNITGNVETLVGSAVPISALVARLQGRSGRIVFDRTELNELFDFSIQFDTTPVPPVAPSTTALVRGIAELGLNLEPATATVEVLVIDRAEKPDTN